MSYINKKLVGYLCNVCGFLATDLPGNGKNQCPACYEGTLEGVVRTEHETINGNDCAFAVLENGKRPMI